MLSSAFFTMGKTHNVCQDYALAGVTQSNNRRYAVLSDGCSSVAHTDVGARLVALNAVEKLTNYPYDRSDHSHFGYLVLAQARHYLKSNLSVLDDNCLTATLLIAEELADGNVRASIFGDGFVLARRRNGMIDIFQIDFQNYPFYPLYLLSDDYAKAYFQNGPKTKSLTVITLDPVNMQIVNTNTVNTAYTYEEFISKTGQQQTDPIELWSCVFNSYQYDLIVVASDGVDSFFSINDRSHTPFESVIAQLVSIKTFAGEFMLRRGRAVTRDVCELKGWTYHDDVSLAAIYLGSEKKNEGLCKG